MLGQCPDRATNEEDVLLYLEMKGSLDIPPAFFAGDVYGLEADRIFIEGTENFQPYSVKEAHVHIKSTDQVGIN